MICVGYCRVSTEGQADGLSFEAQRSTICNAISIRDEWTLAEVVEEQGSAKGMVKRPQLQRVLHHLDTGVYQALMVSRLDRLSRSVGDFAQIMERASAKGWALVCLDPAVDMTTPYGRALAQMSAVFAQLERELISQRTREAMAHMRARGEYTGGIPRFGDKPGDRDVIRRMLAWDEQGLTGREICRRLDALGIPRPSGKPGAWDSSTVSKVLRRERR